MLLLLYSRRPNAVFELLVRSARQAALHYVLLYAWFSFPATSADAADAVCVLMRQKEPHLLFVELAQQEML
jgi:hypothetical protein